MTQEEAKAEFYEEMKADAMADAMRDADHESNMRTDYDYCYDYFDFNEGMTISEFKSAVRSMNEYWSVSELDIIMEI